MSDKVEATAYLAVRAIRSRYGKQEVRGAQLRRITQGRPALATDEIAVKITVQVPAAAFGPFTAAAVVDIPAELVAASNVEVTAEDAND